MKNKNNFNNNKFINKSIKNCFNKINNFNFNQKRIMQLNKFINNKLIWFCYLKLNKTILI